MKDFFVSVIIPVFNAEKYIRNAVESALMQEETGEIILIEDGSGDNSLQVCYVLENEYKEKIRVLRHPFGKNKGAGKSRNLGIRKAKYNYIAFLDADDWFLNDRFKITKKVFAENIDAEGVYEAVEINRTDLDSELTFKVDNLVTFNESVDPKDLFFKMGPIGSSGTFLMNGIVLSKDVFKKCGYFNRLEIGEDTHLWLRLALKCRLYPGVLEKPIAIYRFHQNNRAFGNDKLFRTQRLKLYISLILWSVLRFEKYWKIQILIKEYIAHFNNSQHHKDLTPLNRLYYSVFCNIVKKILGEN